MGLPDCLFRSNTHHAAERPVKHRNAQRLVQNHDAICILLNDSVQALLFFVDLLVKARIFYSNGCLFGKTGQQGSGIIGQMVGCARQKDVNQANCLAAADHGQSYHLRKSQIRTASHNL